MKRKESEKKMREELLGPLDEWAEKGRQLMNFLRREDLYGVFKLSTEELLELVEAAIMTRGITGQILEMTTRLLKKKRGDSIDLICFLFRAVLRIKKETKALEKVLLRIISKGLKRDYVLENIERFQGFRFFYPKMRRIIEKAPFEE